MDRDKSGVPISAPFVFGGSVEMHPTILDSRKALANSDGADALTRVRASNDLGHWIKMFLVGIVETAEKGKRTFEKILALKEKAEEELACMGRQARNGRRLLTLLYREPTVNVAIVARELKISHVAAERLVRTFVKTSLLKEITGLRRNRLFQFKQYLKLFLN